MKTEFWGYLIPASRQRFTTRERSYHFELEHPVIEVFLGKIISFRVGTPCNWGNFGIPYLCRGMRLYVWTQWVHVFQAAVPRKYCQNCRMHQWTFWDRCSLLRWSTNRWVPRWPLCCSSFAPTSSRVSQVPSGSPIYKKKIVKFDSLETFIILKQIDNEDGYNKICFLNLLYAIKILS